MNKIKLQIFFLLLFAGFQAFGQEKYVDGVRGNAINNVGSTFDVEEQYFQCAVSNNCPVNFTLENTKLYTKLWFEESIIKQFPNSAWQIKVEYTIDIHGTVIGNLPTLSSQELVINYNPNGNYQDIDITLFKPDPSLVSIPYFYNQAEIEITGFKLTDLSNTPISSPFSSTTIPKFIHFDVELEVDRNLDISEKIIQNIPTPFGRILQTINTPVIRVGNYNTSKNELSFNWDFIHGAVEYDFEYLVLEGDKDFLNNPIDYDFKNATRVTTKNNFYSISMAYPESVILFRVRPIGYERINLIPAPLHRKEGNWSALKFGRTNVSSSTYTGSSVKKHTFRTNIDNRVEAFYWKGHDNSKNWQYSAVFAENGKKKEVIQYSNGLLMEDQSVTVLNTDETAIIKQTVLDWIGRESLNILPTPQISKGIQYYDHLHYNNTLITSTNYEEYSYKDFDLDNKVNKPEPLNAYKEVGVENLGAGNYFSKYNQQKLGINYEFIPNANGFPYTRTIFLNDGTGRIKEQTGIGKAGFFDGGVGNNEIAHSTKFFYDVPDQIPLLMLFGNNVGFKNFYERTVKLSPNGQASAIYKDLAGRVIATSLIGDPPDNLTAIDTKPDTYPQITENLNPPNASQRVDDKLIINNKFTSTGGIYTFDYKLPGAVFNDCLTKDCVYDIRIMVLDEYGAKLDINYNGVNVNEIVETATQTTSINFSLNLSFGSYQIVKELSLNQANLDSIVVDYIDFNLDDTNPIRCLEPRIIDPVDCAQDCEEACTSQYVTPQNNGISLLYNEEGRVIGERVNGVDNVYSSSDQPDYDDIFGVGGIIEVCITECENYDYTDLENLPDECDIKYELLKTDMSPRGQYFDNLPDSNPTGYPINDWLVNNISPTEKTKIKQCLNITSEFPSDEEFWDFVRANWQEEWGDVMIQYHPEYCLFEQTCCPTGGCPEIPRTPTSTLAVLELSFDYCYQTSPLDQAKIDSIIAARTPSYITQSDSIVSNLPDASLAPFFTPAKLEERERAFYEDYYKYHSLKDACATETNPSLYIPGDDAYGATYRGFQIRYPAISLYDNFDPDDPTAIQDEMKAQNCEMEAQILTNKFMDSFNCKDLLTLTQLEQLEKDIYETALKNCEDELNYDMNEKIEDLLSCLVLPKSCYGSALPEPIEGSCECDNVFSFVEGVLRNNGARYNFPHDLYHDPSLATAPVVQNELDTYLDDNSLKPEFKTWFENCQDYANWHGANDPATYPIDSSFSCDDFGPSEEDTIDIEDCGEQATAYMQHQEDLRFEAEVRAAAQQFRLDYIEYCLANAEEQFTKSYEFKEYHFTLYYFDLSGNLTQTVPPAGIQQNDTGHNSLLKGAELIAAENYLYDNSSSFVWPEHVMYTNFQYNSLNAVESQLMPDHGNPNIPVTQVTKLFYDAMGRLIVSQNPYQKSQQFFSYMVYDDLGRNIEAGQLFNNQTMDKEKAENLQYLHNNTNPDLYGDWFSNGNKNEFTRSHYDKKPASSNLIYGQGNLRNRIAMVVNYEDGINPSFATHYSYDELGNVKDMWQENYDLQTAVSSTPFSTTNHSFKHFKYIYELISGNVNQVHYQKGFADQFSHKYLYDADNRLTHAFTSTNDIIWNNDATYFYYAHGPLARIEVGQNKVFADDYINSIQGWLTAKNSSTLNERRDAGLDGVRNRINENIGKDPFAFSLHYFDNHYSPIESSRQDVVAKLNHPDHLTKASTNLYNGNITNMVVSMRDLNGKPMDVMDYQFEYDQLQRLKRQIPLWDKTSNTPLADNEFSNSSNQQEDYNLYTKFDGNGNLMGLQRHGTDTYIDMDKFKYKYDVFSTSTGNARKNNRLIVLEDGAPSNNYDLDIENTHDYKYDELGRLVEDPAEDIDRINWNASNKVTEIIKTLDPETDQNVNLGFGYGPMGDRTLKVVKKKDTSGNLLPVQDWEYNWYVLDAQGNPIAVYKYQKDASGVLQLVLKELTIYGADRLGMKNKNIKVYER